MIVLCVVLILICWTANAENKTKRTISQELYNYGETTPIIIYNDNLGSKPLALVNIPQPLKVYDQPFNNKATTQPILYEFQQYPTNMILEKQPLHSSNNLNQPFQYQRYQEPISSTTTLHKFVPSNTVILPIQGQSMSLYENHQPSSLNEKFHYFPHSQQQLPRKYIQSNDRFFYNQNINLNPHLHRNINNPQITEELLTSSQPHHQSLPHYHRFPQNTEKPVIMDYPNNNYAPRQIMAQGNISPNTNGKFIIPQRKQHFPINFPTKPESIKREEKTKEASDYNLVKDNAESEVSAKEKNNENDHSEEEEQDPAFNKYSFDYEDNDNLDKSSVEAYEDDEDKGDSTKFTAFKKHMENILKTEKPNYSHLERYRDSSNRADGKSQNKSVKQPKMILKSIKYSRANPKVDYLEGRYTESIPVTHKHRIFKEKWYLSKKNIDDNEAN